MTTTHDYQIGYRRACEMLHDLSSAKAELYPAPANWKATTAQTLIDTAQMRLNDGINPEYQRGVIARAQEELQ